MTLEPTGTQAAVETQKVKKKSKKGRARDLALQYKNLPYDDAKTKIMEEIPCSRSTAVKALKWIEKQEAKERAEKPRLEVIPETERKPEFIRKPEKPIEEIEKKREEKPIIEEMKPEEVQEQLDLFKDMLRGLHVLLISKDGVLGSKYGRDPKQVMQASDQLYRWLLRRYGIEDLEKYDTILLVLSYGTLVGGIGKDVLAERRKKESAASKKE